MSVHMVRPSRLARSTLGIALRRSRGLALQDEEVRWSALLCPARLLARKAGACRLRQNSPRADRGEHIRQAFLERPARRVHMHAGLGVERLAAGEDGAQV